MSTKVFTSYDAAVSFANKQGIKAIGRPYRRLVWIDGVQTVVWSVAIK